MGRFLTNLYLILPVLLFGCFGSYLSDNRAPADYLLQNEIQIQGVNSLDGRSREFIGRYGPVIEKYSNKYGFDWRLMLAVMKMESRFHTGAESHKGAEGLMQIMPYTQVQIASELGFSEEDFVKPHVNIRGGIYYFGKIYKSLDAQGLTERNRLELTLAAYNAGYGRIADAQKIAEYMNDDPSQWLSIKSALPLLSRKYVSIHREIWESGRPSSGYFRNWRQTINYVEDVMGYYREYRKMLPEDLQSAALVKEDLLAVN
ncbi:MAG: transglycosylase SLT domain-containing protein [Bacteroidota bacterium]|nr:transglycosylase SLT domain-containing protein [Bacteroidota bacterium]